MKFGKYWQGSWPWPDYRGVGLKLTGFPNDVEAFRQFMYSESCNPIAVERIITELRATGVKLTTVQSSLNFCHIGDELSRMGVKLEITEPVDRDRINDGTIDYAALRLKLNKNLDPCLTPEQTVEAQRRAAATPQLLSKDLGPYSRLS